MRAAVLLAPIRISLCLVAGAGLPACMHTSGRPLSVDLLQEPSSAPWVVKELLELEAQYDAATQDPTQRRLRNRFARKMLALTDKNYNGFLDDLVRQRKAFDATSDITAISLDTASVLFTPATTKSILAGLSGLTTAGKTAVNKVYFYEQTLPVMISQMSADRQRVLADIQEGLTLDVTQYPLLRLLSDLQRYYLAGTIDGALQSVQRQAARTAEDAEERILALVREDVKAAESRRTAALTLIRQEAGFDALRVSIGEWWARLSEDAQLEQLDVIRAWAAEHGVGAPTLVRRDEAGNVLHDEDGKELPNRSGLGAFLDSLEATRQKDQLLLADIARNAAGLELPKP